MELPENEIITGDCLEVMKGWPDGCVDLTVTSPPYNMRTRIRDGKYTEREQSSHFCKKYSHFSDALHPNEYYEFHNKVISELLRIGTLVFWNIQIVTGSKEAIFRLIGEYHKEIRDIIIWDKGNGEPAISAGVINRAAELIIIFENDGRAGRMFGRHNFERGTMQDIWRFGKGEHVEGNAACFNVELPLKAIKSWSRPGDLILDPFCGSGTTCVAAKKLSRIYIGIDISEEYCQIARDRLRAVETGVPVKEARKGQRALFD